MDKKLSMAHAKILSKIDDPEYVIKNDKLNIYTRLKRYYDLFGDYHTRRVRS